MTGIVSIHQQIALPAGGPASGKQRLHAPPENHPGGYHGKTEVVSVIGCHRHFGLGKLLQLRKLCGHRAIALPAPCPRSQGRSNRSCPTCAWNNCIGMTGWSPANQSMPLNARDQSNRYVSNGRQQGVPRAICIVRLAGAITTDSTVSQNPCCGWSLGCRQMERGNPS